MENVDRRWESGLSDESQGCVARDGLGVPGIVHDGEDALMIADVEYGVGQENEFGVLESEVRREDGICHRLNGDIARHELLVEWWNDDGISGEDDERSLRRNGQ